MMLSLKELRRFKKKAEQYGDADFRFNDEDWHVLVYRHELVNKRADFLGTARYSEVVEVFGRYQ